ncbi:MAG: HEAT repeat domain-containing protein [Lentisphaerae bacterium]|nr:HEAT repeat domain-containing protein [Lentisphaerota bacterium]
MPKSMTGTGRVLVLCAAWLAAGPGMVCAEDDAGGVKIGDRAPAVLEKLGEPSGRLSMGGRQTWMYSGFSVILEDGQVVDVPGLSPPVTERAAVPAAGFRRPRNPAGGELNLERRSEAPVDARDMPVLMEMIRTRRGLELARAVDRCIGPEAVPAIPLLIPLLGDTTGFTVTTYMGGGKISEGTTTMGQLAADALGTMGLPAWHPCVERLRQGTPFERANVAVALMRLWKNFNATDRSFPTLLVEVFRSPVMEADKPALQAKARMAALLEGMDSPEALAALHQAMSNPDVWLNDTVVRILGRRRKAASIPFLAKQFLGHADAAFRERAGEALEAYKDPAAARAAMGGLTRPEAEMRRITARILGAVKEASMVPPLLRLLRDRDLEVRREALRGLGRIESPDSILPLIEVVKDEPDEWMSQNAASYLNGLVMTNRDPEVVQALGSGLRHRDAKRRVRLTDLAGRTGAPELYEPLARLAREDREPEVRRTAMMHLDRFDDPGKAAVFLECLAEERDERVRGTAMQVVKYGSLRDRQVEILLGILRGRDADRAREAAFILDELHRVNRHPEVLDVLIKTLTHEDAGVRERAESILCREADIPRFGAQGKEFGGDPEKWRTWWRDHGIVWP